ncbi:hypothetical protein GCK32_001865 [Trichostrongylus colubriformis]|uniref:Protein SPT2 homolog n=1 Tax=Trichostrongylus colubriformis TaxID=6319 RepID=A0AAN8FDQ4_TRICO
MDFMQLLDTANKNAKSLTKKLDVIKSEVDNEKRSELKRIESERRMKMESLKRKKDSSTSNEVEKKFTIPKKRKEASDEDKAKVLAYLAKKAEEERQEKKRKEAEKERLIQLRLQAHGGKASKKIAKNFGLSALEMQVRYGHDHEHVERLQKQMWREEEEQDRLASQYRDGVYKAIAHKREVEEKVRRSQSKQPSRAGTSRNSSAAGPSSRPQNSSSRPSSSRDVAAQPKGREPVTEMKKPKPTEALDFESLMKTAKDIAEGKNCSLDSHRTDQNKEKNSSHSMHALPRIAKTSDVSSSKTQSSRETDSHSSARYGKQAGERGRFKKGPTPPPLIPPAVPGKRYLPGDIRYKQAMEAAKSGASSSNAASSVNKAPSSNFGRDHPVSSKTLPKPDSYSKRKEEYNKYDSRKREPERTAHVEKVKPQSSSSRSQNHISRERHDVRPHDRKMDRSRDYRDGSRARDKYHDYNQGYDYDVTDEDEYDSEMDDFIDDSGLDMDELSRQEFEETLKLVNPKYNKKKWKEREQTISLKDMHADFRTIAREEARSARIGLIEDLHEATKGKSEAL